MPSNAVSPTLPPITQTIGTAEGQTLAEIRRQSALADTIYRNASEIEGYYSSKDKQASLLKEIMSLIKTMEELPVRITVSQRGLVTDQGFRAELLLLANNIQHACSELRDMSAAGCFGQRDYLGNGKLRQKCIVLMDKVKSFNLNAFKLSLGATGTVELGGDNSTNYTAGTLDMTEDNLNKTVEKTLPTPEK